MHVAHHMMVYGCTTPGDNQSFWSASFHSLNLLSFLRLQASLFGLKSQTSIWQQFLWKITSRKTISVAPLLQTTNPYNNITCTVNLRIFLMPSFSQGSLPWCFRSCPLLEDSSKMSVCGDGGRQIVFAWANDAPSKNLPDGNCLKY